MLRVTKILRVGRFDIKCFGDVVALWRCGGSLVVRQTSEAEVPGSNPASPIMIGAAGSMCHTVKSQGRGENLHLRP